MIHQYKLGGYNIVLDIASGAVHVVDDIAYDIISMFEDKSREDIISAVNEKYVGKDGVTADDVIECYEQIETLRDNGQLFTPDTFEGMAGALKEKTSGVIKALCLHIAHT
ncbi:MAG: PqqD family peptide modification chaperone, partial [Clostridia bacterium]|nr:PqqD family peptide modification chaperone [Clostridia bacterium]